MKRALAILLAWSAGVTPILASGEGGTESPFAFGAGARDLALAGAALTTGDPTTAPFWNPARLTTAERFGITGFHSQIYESDVAYQYLGLVWPTLDAGTFGLGVFRLGVDGIEALDALGIRQGEFGDSRLGMYLAYGRTFSKFDLGAAVSLEHHSLGDYSSTSSPGLDLSASRRVLPRSAWLKEASFVVHVRNVIRPSTKLVDEATEYPTAVDAGLSLDIGHAGNAHSLTLSAAASKVADVDWSTAIGAEYRFHDWVALRGGLRAGKTSFGAGLGYGAFAFDYALVDRDFGSLHMFTLTLSFGTPVSVRRQERSARQEAEFNRLMSDRLATSNRDLARRLLADGVVLANQGQLEGALDHFDRALFLARSSDLDTSQASELWSSTLQKIDQQQSEERYRLALDSAHVRQRQADFIGSRYFANLALAEVPGSTEAQAILKECTLELQQSTEREKTIEKGLLVVDSLLSYGQFQAASQTAEALRQVDGNNPAVQAAVRRTRFEHWRAAATTAYAAGSYPQAAVALDSALALFPGHQVCLDLQASVQRAMAAAPPRAESSAAAAPQALSRELEAQVRSLYESGRQAFEQGLLAEAISRWEKVELLAPGYQAVRSYLVNAYKFVGVEHYGQDRPEEAIAAWRKAAFLDPDNAEIANYIRRTENEMRRLKEISHGR